MKIKQIRKVIVVDGYISLTIKDNREYKYTIVYYEGEVSLNLWNKVRKVKWKLVR